MTAERVIAGLHQAGQAAAAEAEARAAAMLAAAADAALAGQAVQVGLAEAGAVTLTGKGLQARAFGSRRRAADPLFAGLLATLARGEMR